MNIFNRRDKQAEKALAIRLAIEDQIVEGQQVKNFFDTDLGKYIERKIEDDVQAVKNKLVYAEIEEVPKLQVEYKMLNRIKLYFAMAITAGNNAEQALDLRQED